MTSSKSTKRALISSALAILMCVAMLIGTTFAWFTDTASTGVNKIQAGNLKMEVSYKNTSDGEFIVLNESTNVFKQDTLWEPGHVEYAVLNVKNIGTLALKYKLGINIAGETGSTNVLGNEFKLSDYIKFGVVDDDLSGKTRDEMVAAVTDSKLIKEGYSKESHLDTTDANETVTLVVWMPTDVGNKANYKVGAAVPEINLGINVAATQYTHESDSFGNQYDRYAQYPDVTVVQLAAGDETAVNNALKDAIAAAKTADATTGKPTPTQIVLPANTTVTLESGVATPAQGQTSDIKITGDKTTKIKFQNSTGGSDGSGTTYQDRANLTFQGVTISGGTEQFVARGGVVTFIDCTINGEIKKTTADKFVFSGCTFTKPVSQVGYGCKDVIFSNCVFNTDGYGIKIYSEGYYPVVNLTVKNCTFNNSGSAAKSAIFLDHIIDDISYNITVDSCSFSGFTATPTANDNRYAPREIVADSFVKTSDGSDGQYIFSYQTGVESGSYHKILTSDQLVVTVE